MAFKIPPLPNARLVDERGFPNAIFQQYWQQLTQALEGALLTIADVVDVTLPSYSGAIAAANAAAASANTAAATANAAAATNSAAVAAAAKEQALVNSYIEPTSVLSATSTTITIASHTRHYADGTTASVTGGTAAATATGDTDYVSYSDPTRAGGAVTYIVSTTAPVQTGDTHVVGAVMIPTTGSAHGGQGPLRPGYVEP